MLGDDITCALPRLVIPSVQFPAHFFEMRNIQVEGLCTPMPRMCERNTFSSINGSRISVIGANRAHFGCLIVRKLMDESTFRLGQGTRKEKVRCIQIAALQVTKLVDLVPYRFSTRKSLRSGPTGIIYQVLSTCARYCDGNYLLEVISTCT